MENQADFALIAAVPKAISYICFTVIVCFWVSSCQLDEKIITECQKSCSTYTTHMKSVTSRECECSALSSIEQNSINDVWVLPKN